MQPGRMKLCRFGPRQLVQYATMHEYNLVYYAEYKLADM